MYFERIIPVEEILAKVDAVTADDLQAISQEVFGEERCAMAILGPATDGSPGLKL